MNSSVLKKMFSKIFILCFSLFFVGHCMGMEETELKEQDDISTRSEHRLEEFTVYDYDSHAGKKEIHVITPKQTTIKIEETDLLLKLKDGEPVTSSSITFIKKVTTLSKIYLFIVKTYLIDYYVRCEKRIFVIALDKDSFEICKNEFDMDASYVLAPCSGSYNSHSLETMPDKLSETFNEITIGAALGDGTKYVLNPHTGEIELEYSSSVCWVGLYF